MKYERFKRRKLERNTYDPQKAYDDAVKEVNAGIRNALNGIVKIVLTYCSGALTVFLSLLLNIEDNSKITELTNKGYINAVIVIFILSIILTIILLGVEQLAVKKSLENMETAIKNDIDDPNKIFNIWDCIFYILEFFIIILTVCGSLLMAYCYTVLFNIN